MALAIARFRNVRIAVRSLPDKRMFVVPGQRLAILQTKVETLRKQLKDIDNEVDKEEIYVELQKTKRALDEIVADPLTNDFCIDEPWADECRIYDD